jgi:MoaA/NifB/PqqE/SkfB family radical SAM enzyme
MTNSAIKLVLRLLINGVRFRCRHAAGKPGRPQALSLEVTHDCVARCVMCNIWKIPRDVQNLPVTQWIELLSSDLFADIRELDITGGEPFIRDDLFDLFYGICELKHKNLPALKSIAVTTNGLLTDRVVSTVERTLPALQKKGLDLVVVCALDAVGELHNRIRNYPDAWSKVSKTIEELTLLRDRHPNLIVGLKTTILPLNIDELSKISEFADHKGLFTIISPCIITEGRYLNPDRAEDLSFNQENIEKMIDFFSSNQNRWDFHADSLIDFFKTGSMKKPCSCGFNYFFIRSNGEMYLCPLIQESIGNITKKDISDLFFSNKANITRRQIGRLPQCRICTEPGLERYSLPYEGFQYLKLFFKMGSDEFFQLHYYLGLDKYMP